MLTMMMIDDDDFEDLENMVETTCLPFSCHNHFDIDSDDNDDEHGYDFENLENMVETSCLSSVVQPSLYVTPTLPFLT